MASEAELGTRLDKAMLYLEMDEARLLKKAQVIILELADDENYAPAQKILGDLYGKGELFKKDENKARYWHDRASGQVTSVSENQYISGRKYECFKLASNIILVNNITNKEKYEHRYYTVGNAVMIFRALAEENYAPAQTLLGRCYTNGNGIRQDDYKAVKWYEKAAENDDAWGQYYLGNCYMKGQGVEQNYDEAFKWYHRAALQDLACAQSMLGVCYKKGLGIKVNKKEADRWAKKAMSQVNIDIVAAGEFRRMAEELRNLGF